MKHHLSRFISTLLFLAGYALVAFVQTIPAQIPASVADKAARSATLPVQPAPATMTPSIPLSPAIARVGLLATRSSGDALGAQAMADQVKLLLSQLLTSSNVEAVTIASTIPEAAVMKAKAKNCNFLLASSLDQKKAGGLGVSRMMMLQSASAIVPLAGLGGGVASMIGTSIAGTALNQVSTINSLVHARTTYTFGYRLTSLRSAVPPLTSTETAKSQKDGDDFVSPLLRHAVDAVANQLATR